jgi:hypothetical protein
VDREVVALKQQLDVAIARVAVRQGGHITRRQLIGLGATRHAIGRRLRAGTRIQVHRGVYAVGNLPTNRQDAAAGALLACGPNAVLSHSSAGALWGMLRQWTLPIEVTVADDRRRPAVRIHISRALAQADVRRKHGLRATSPARTVADLAPRLPPRRLGRVVNDARLARLLTQSELRDLVDRLPANHAGIASLLPLVAEVRGPTRSELEDAFQAFLGAHGLPQPVVNATIAGHEVDAYFEAERVIVELDGFEVHRTRAQFERDRARDARILAATGIPTVRLTHARLMGHPAREAALLREILSAR